MHTGKEYKEKLIAKLVNIWNAHSYDEIPPVDPDRFVSYSHFLASISAAIVYGNFDGHSSIELTDESAPSIILINPRGYNYVFCSDIMGTRDTIYGIFAQVGQKSDRWVVDLTACSFIDELLFWLLPFLRKEPFSFIHNSVNFRVDEKTVKWNNDQRILEDWMGTNIPCSSLDIVAPPGIISRIIEITSGRVECKIYSSATLSRHPRIGTYTAFIGDMEVSLPLDKWSDFVARHDNIVNAELPRELWPY